MSSRGTSIRQFNSAGSFGISFQPTGLTNLFVTNTAISKNGSGATGGGILMQPTGTGAARVLLENVHVFANSNNGITADTTLTSGFVGFTLDNSQVSGNSGSGVVANAGGGIGGMITNSAITANILSGISTAGGLSTLRVGNTTITGNASGGGAGVNLAGGIARSYGDNLLDDNSVDGGFTSVILKK